MVAAAVFNVASTSTIVVLNKHVFSTYAFKFPILLVCVHMAITWAGMRGAAALGTFKLKPVGFRSAFLLAAVFNGYNVSSLANLRLNSVGIYQLTKILIAPAVMVTEFALFNKRTSGMVKLAVAIMCIGVVAATVTDVQVHTVGMVASAAAIAGATAYQLSIARLQERFDASSNQLLTACIPTALLIGLFMTPIDSLLTAEAEGDAAAITPLQWWHSENANPEALFVIGLSGVAGLMVSLSTFLFIGAAGPLTYNVVGHIKTVTVLTSGWLVFGDFMSTQKLLGLMCTMAGIVLYSVVKMRENSAQKMAEK
ncbi:MAG: hypothetical protein AAFY66_04195 [Pseudomonadota bacterium]